MPPNLEHLTGPFRWDLLSQNRSDYVGFERPKPVKLGGTDHLTNMNEVAHVGA